MRDDDGLYQCGRLLFEMTQGSPHTHYGSFPLRPLSVYHAAVMYNPSRHIDTRRSWSKSPTALFNGRDRASEESGTLNGMCTSLSDNRPVGIAHCVYEALAAVPRTVAWYPRRGPCTWSKLDRLRLVSHRIGNCPAMHNLLVIQDSYQIALYLAQEPCSWGAATV